MKLKQKVKSLKIEKKRIPISEKLTKTSWTKDEHFLVLVRIWPSAIRVLLTSHQIDIQEQLATICRVLQRTCSHERCSTKKSSFSYKQHTTCTYSLDVRFLNKKKKTNGTHQQHSRRCSIVWKSSGSKNCKTRKSASREWQWKFLRNKQTLLVASSQTEIVYNIPIIVWLTLRLTSSKLVSVVQYLWCNEIVSSKLLAVRRVRESKDLSFLADFCKSN